MGMVYFTKAPLPTHALSIVHACLLQSVVPIGHLGVGALG